LRALIVLALFTMVALLAPDVRPTAERAGDWIIDTGIYGTYDHFGNPIGVAGLPARSYLCGIAYELRYAGQDRIEGLDIAARFPDDFAGHTPPVTREYARGWRRPAVPATGAGSLADAALWKHAGGAVGAVCNGPLDLFALRGTELRIDWRSSAGDHEEVFTIVFVRGEVTLCGGSFTRDGQIRPVWGRGTCA
jgi:hypothetical protein